MESASPRSAVLPRRRRGRRQGGGQGVRWVIAKIQPLASDSAQVGEAEADFGSEITEPPAFFLAKFSNPVAGFTRFEEGDILFAKITPCMENGKGAFARNLANSHGFGSTEFHVLRANDRGDAEFVYHLVQSTEVRTKAITFFTGDRKSTRLNSSHLG